MAASVLGSGVFGLKTYTSFRAGTRFLILLYDSATGDLLSMVQGARCSLLRTSAVSAVATQPHGPGEMPQPSASLERVSRDGANWKACAPSAI